MSTNLNELLTGLKKAGIEYEIIAGDSLNPEITDLVNDSRKAGKGSLYFSWPGVHVHGNSFIAKAVEAGAKAVIFQDQLPEGTEEVCRKNGAVLVRVKDSRIVMAPVSAAFYGNPSSKMIVIGVTGTEGKSTTVSLIWQLLRLCGKKAGFFSTVQYSLGGEALANPEHQTTPEAPAVQQKLAMMAENGCEFAVVESSSHGLSKKLNRLGCVDFDAAVFMNVTHEHLEFHGTFEQYRHDKANLFRALGQVCHEKTVCGKKISIKPFGVVNVEDPSAQYFVDAAQSSSKNQSPVEVIGFTTGGQAGSGNPCKEVPAIPVEKGSEIRSDSKGLTFVLNDSISVKAPLPGAFNVYNAMAAMMVVSRLAGISLQELAPKAAELVPVKGRMTTVSCGQPFEVIVDYAHTPSSFMTVFPPLRQRCNGRIFVLFGSGGERDTKKRPEQGRIASQWCDMVFLTDEDPRGEEPMALLEDIASGVDKKMVRGENLFLIPDRPSAIRKAFSLAKEGDIVLLLGKAHENSIIYKDFVMPYDEISEAVKALGEIGYGTEGQT